MVLFGRGGFGRIFFGIASRLDGQGCQPCGELVLLGSVEG